MVWPVAPLATLAVGVVSVPVPSAALIVIVAPLARFVRVPPTSVFSLPVKLAVPVPAGTVTVAYVSVTWPLAIVIPVTGTVHGPPPVIVPIVPVLTDTWPAPAPVMGAVQPAGMMKSTSPFVRPPLGTL